MSKRYTAAEKDAILKRLRANHGDMARTAREVEIPLRTLRNWTTPEGLEAMREAAAPVRQYPKFIPPRLQDEIDRAEARYAESNFDKLYNKLMEDALALSQRFMETAQDAPPASQIMALTRLIDRLLKLDERKPRLDEQERYNVMVIEYGYPTYPQPIKTPVNRLKGYQQPSMKMRTLQNIADWEKVMGQPAPTPPVVTYDTDHPAGYEWVASDEHPLVAAGVLKPDEVPDEPYTGVDIEKHVALVQASIDREREERVKVNELRQANHESGE